MPVNIEQIENIYYQFRKVQAEYNNRGFRLPKNFESHFNSKFKEQNKKALIKITGWFITKWCNVDPYEYFKCGFDLYKQKFSYIKFFDEKILLLYKTRDKNKKREIRIVKEEILKSAKFVKQWINKRGISLDEYMHISNENRKIAVDHYIKNKIDASFFVFLIRRGMILTDNDRSMIPYIQENFRKIIFGLDEIKIFVRKMEERL